MTNCQRHETAKKMKKMGMKGSTEKSKGAELLGNLVEKNSDGSDQPVLGSCGERESQK